MFMAKSELVNIRNLVKIKMKTQQRQLFWFFVLAAFLYVGSIMATIASILQNTDIRLHTMFIPDFSTAFYFGLIIYIFGSIFYYRQSNHSLSMFPQTNTGRFISTQVIKHFIIVCVGLTILIAYLLFFGTMKLFSEFHENFSLVLDFDIGFILAGFLTFILYLSLIVSLFGLIGAVLRKWRYYAVIFFIALFTFVMNNVDYTFDNLPRIFAFIVRESSLLLFIAIAVGLWFIITMISLVINRYTLYYKSESVATIKKRTFALGGIAIIVLVVIISLFSPRLSQYGADEMRVVGVGENHFQLVDFFDDETEIIIDISHLPQGSNIRFVGENNIIVACSPVDDLDLYTTWHILAWVNSVDELTNIDGNTIVIKYFPPHYIVDGVDLMNSANPELTVNLDGNTLYMSFNMDYTHLVILPVWSMANQFDIFSNRNIVSAAPLLITTVSTGDANVLISVE
jgi:hypothetical protein